MVAIHEFYANAAIFTCRFEVEDLASFIHDSAQHLSRATPLANLQSSDSIADHFQSFLKGGRDVFMGGSIHARLLMNWWMPYCSRFAILLAPAHFQYLLPEQWPLRNRLWFDDALAATPDRGGRTESFDSLRRT